MDRRDFLAKGAVGIGSTAMLGAILLPSEESPDPWKIGEFKVTTRAYGKVTASVSIHEEDTLICEQDVTLPWGPEDYIRSVSLTGYPTDLGVYTVRAVFGSGDDAVEAELPPSHKYSNQDCYNITATHSGRFFRNTC